MASQTLQNVAQRAEAIFLDDAFSQPYGAQLGDITKHNADSFEPDDRFSHLADVQSTADLKKLVSAPDRAALEELSSHDPKLRESIQDEMAGEVAEKFVAAHPEYQTTDRNYELLVEWLCRIKLGRASRGDGDVEALLNAGEWTLANLEAAYRALSKAGRLDVPTGSVRNLTNEELREVAAAIHTDGLEAALVLYLQKATGLRDLQTGHGSVRAFLAAHPQLANEASFFVWRQSRPKSMQTADFKDFIREFFKGRVLITVADLDAAHEEFLRQRQANPVERAPEAAPVSEREVIRDLESRSDEEVAKTMQDTLRARAAAIRRGEM